MPKPKTTRTASVHAMACATLLSIGALTACTPGIDRRGFVPDETDTQPIQSGVDTKSTVLARYGTPSTVAAFDDNSWYYISDTKERRTYHLPTTTQRTVLAIKFGQNDVVDGVKTYGITPTARRRHAAANCRWSNRSSETLAAPHCRTATTKSARAAKLAHSLASWPQISSASSTKKPSSSALEGFLVERLALPSQLDAQARPAATAPRYW